MKPYLTYLLLTTSTTLLVVWYFSITISIYHVLAVPVVVFVGLAAVTSVDKVFFLNYKRSLSRGAKEPVAMSEDEMLEKFASSGTETHSLRKTRGLSSNFLVMIALWMLLIGMFSALFYSSSHF